MNIAKSITTTVMVISSMVATASTPVIARADANVVKSEKMTPEVLWSMGRVAAATPSPDGKKIVYQVGYYSIKENKGHQMLYIVSAEGGEPKLLTTSEKSETDAATKDLLEKFRKDASSNLRQTWTNIDDLAFKVKDSLERSIEICPRVGWVRTDSIVPFMSVSLEDIDSKMLTIDDFLKDTKIM